jgi:hypothetical protein
MKKDFLLKNLIEVLQNRFPERGRLANELTELLDIEKEAVYRRLRGSVPFSFQEVYKIATHLGFSLDGIAENNLSPARPMTMMTIELLDMDESDYKLYEDFIEIIEQLKDDPHSESGAIGSIIPSSFSPMYDNISKFYLFKWLHQFGGPSKMRLYSETKVPELLKQFNLEFVEIVRNVALSVFIFDRRFLQHFVNDVRFFYDIRLISKKDVQQIKEDLYLFINDLERFATKGNYDTGGKVEIFLANIHFDANYSYINASNFKLTLLRSFSFSDSFSFDEVVSQNMKNWLNFLRRTSTLISEGNPTERVHFFERQRKIIDSM